VRLIGVDTPETVHPTKWVDPYWQKASNFTKNILENKTVQLEFDVQERDQYGRLLAYIWIGGKMFNKTLLSEGYAYASTRVPNVKYTQEFQWLQAVAFEEKKWLRQLEEYATTQSVNINTATLEQLKNIVHIDDERAQQIISLRPFNKVEDLTRVKWIAAARVAEILAQWIATVE
jgi:DNA uptake protein ComE-like DNA-binding protein